MVAIANSCIEFVYFDSDTHHKLWPNTNTSYCRPQECIVQVASQACMCMHVVCISNSSSNHDTSTLDNSFCVWIVVLEQLTANQLQPGRPGSQQSHHSGRWTGYPVVSTFSSRAHTRRCILTMLPEFPREREISRTAVGLLKNDEMVVDRYGIVCSGLLNNPLRPWCQLIGRHC